MVRWSKKQHMNRVLGEFDLIKRRGLSYLPLILRDLIRGVKHRQGANNDLRCTQSVVQLGRWSFCLPIHLR